MNIIINSRNGLAPEHLKCQNAKNTVWRPFFFFGYCKMKRPKRVLLIRPKHLRFQRPEQISCCSARWHPSGAQSFLESMLTKPNALRQFLSITFLG